MGHLIRFLRRLRHRFQVWRFKRRERHENAVIAQQQRQMREKQDAWESESASLHKQLRERDEEHERHVKELTAQLETTNAENHRWKSMWTMAEGQIEFLVSKFERGKQEYAEAPGKLVT